MLRTVGEKSVKHTLTSEFCNPIDGLTGKIELWIIKTLFKAVLISAGICCN
jgi:hypothetical protein